MANACDHHQHHVHHGLKGPALARALTASEARCGATGERLTAPRRRVLELLLAADAPMKAYDLIAAFGDRGEPAKPPTVYRALEFLERLGFAHRIESLNSYVPCRIEGAHAMIPKGKKLPRPHPLRVTFGAPVALPLATDPHETGAARSARSAAFAAQLRARVAALPSALDLS